MAERQFGSIEFKGKNKLKITSRKINGILTDRAVPKGNEIEPKLILNLKSLANKGTGAI